MTRKACAMAASAVQAETLAAPVVLAEKKKLAHTLEELIEGARGMFTYSRELPSDSPVWKQYLFIRNL